ncbi:3-oxo-5-alpha-steroid 4-dehydrogenase, putative, partial [Hepatocystis sp. ex Piliocolobus tephrosceles]
MKVILKKRNGKFIDSFDLSPSTTVEQFKEMYYKKYHYYPERQKWNIDSAAGRVLISGTFNENGVKDNEVLVFKDL